MKSSSIAKTIIVLPTTFESCTKDTVGSKAFHLICMQKGELDVPPFVIVPVDVVDELLAPLRSFIEEQIQIINNYSERDLNEISFSIQQKIRHFQPSQEWEERILGSCEHFFGKDYEVSIRSSGLDEDTQGASFAGIHESYLYCNAQNLVPQIMSTIASAWGLSALSYRQQKGLQLKHIQIALIIQKMVPAVRSGVAFSMHQGANLADAVIVAGYGLGTGIVEGKVETDTFFVNRQDRSIQQQLTTKTSQIIKKEDGQLLSPLQEHLQDQACLTTENIQQIYDQLLNAEKLLEAPADIEFSYDKEGRLHLLQMRPVTTINTDQLIILDNTNIVESYPGTTLPLSFSFALKAYGNVFKGASDAFWISRKVMNQHAKVFANLLAHYKGRVYYRLDNWYRMVALVYSSHRSMDAWEKAVGLTHTERGQVHFQFQNQLKAIGSALWLLINLKRNNRRFFKTFAKNYEKLKACVTYRNDTNLLWEHYEQASLQLFKPWYQTLVNDFLAFKMFGWLQNALARYVGAQQLSLANDWISGLGEVLSEKALISTLQLKETIKQDRELQLLFNQDAQQILDQLQTGKYSSFYRNVKEHLQLYGDRTLAELKLETPSFRKAPVHFIELLRNQLQSNMTVAKYRQQQSDLRNKADQLIRSSLPWWHPALYYLRWLRKRAAYGLQNRENMRFCRTKGYGAIKDIFLEIGQLMQKEQLIESTDDVFYLNLEALQAYCTLDKRESLHIYIQELKNQYKTLASQQLPGRIIYEKGAMPDLTLESNTQVIEAGRLKGIPVSGGTITGEAIVVTTPEPGTPVKGRILISAMTDPGWVFLMSQAIGLISEKGSLLSHTAIVGRELGLPVVVGIPRATELFKTGDCITMDGHSGWVEKSKYHEEIPHSTGERAE